MKKESRRNFVKKTAAITSGVVASSLPLASFSNVNEDKKTQNYQLLDVVEEDQVLLYRH